MLNGDKRVVTPLASRYYRSHSSGSVEYQHYIVSTRNRLPRKYSWLNRMTTVLRELLTGSRRVTGL